MNFPSSGALALSATLALGCTTAKVSAPPPPPPQAASAPAKPRPEPAEKAGASSSQSPPAPASESAPAAEGTPPASEGTPPAGAADAPPDPAEEPARNLAGDTQPGTRPDPPLGWIAGQPLEAEELVLEWGDIASRELLLVVDKLVAARLAVAEAGRLGIRLSPEAVQQRFEAEKAKLAEQIASQGKNRSLEEFIQRELGFEPGRYLERVRRATIRQMLAERAVRACSLASESVALRLIVVSGDEQVQKVQAALAEGRDFADVAREFSVDESKKDGGLVPFVVSQERSPLARIAFQTPIGEVAGPLPIADHQFLVRIEERRTPLEGDWARVERTVETSLAQYPVEDAEFVHWKLTMEGRYPIDLGPLWSLIGAAK